MPASQAPAGLARIALGQGGGDAHPHTHKDLLSEVDMGFYLQRLKRIGSNSLGTPAVVVSNASVANVSNVSRKNRTTSAGQFLSRNGARVLDP